MGAVKLWDFAPVNYDDFWVLATRGSASQGYRALLIHYQNQNPVLTIDCGPALGTTTTTGYIVYPRTSGPGGDVYAIILAQGVTTGYYKFVVCHPDGNYKSYDLPHPVCSVYAPEGLVSYEPDEVRYSIWADHANSTIYAFNHGVFSVIAQYAGRVHLSCYPTPSDGWGTDMLSKIYHWTNAGPSDFYNVNGKVNTVAFTDSNHGWAVGKGVSTAPLIFRPVWSYINDDQLIPTSLGRVKAAFE